MDPDLYPVKDCQLKAIWVKFYVVYKFGILPTNFKYKILLKSWFNVNFSNFGPFIIKKIIFGFPCAKSNYCSLL